MNIALITPPIKGHESRGTGIYAQYLFQYLGKLKDIVIKCVEYDQSLHEFDVIHYPYFDPFFRTLPFKKVKPTIVTVHDLIPLRYPNDFPKGIKGSVKWELQKRALKQVDQIITDSNASKEDIISILKVSKDRINTVYLGISDEFKVISNEKMLKKTKTKYDLPDNFIVYVGDINPNKNIPQLLKAFAKSRETHEDIALVLIGQGFIKSSPLLHTLNALISTLNVDNSILKVGRVSKEELVDIYNLAQACIQPSWAEGFGLPVLEAAACGCPTIVSDVSSLKEIRPPKSIPINPYNTESIAEGINKVITLEKTEREKIVNDSLMHVKRFTWEKCAQDTLNVYKKTINHG